MLSKNVEVWDFSIMVVADNLNPSILNPDFLTLFAEFPTLYVVGWGWIANKKLGIRHPYFL
jgi:hypothetical protein